MWNNEIRSNSVVSSGGESKMQLRICVRVVKAEAGRERAELSVNCARFAYLGDLSLASFRRRPCTAT